MITVRLGESAEYPFAVNGDPTRTSAHAATKTKELNGLLTPNRDESDMLTFLVWTTGSQPIPNYPASLR